MVRDEKFTLVGLLRVCCGMSTLGIVMSITVPAGSSAVPPPSPPLWSLSEAVCKETITTENDALPEWKKLSNEASSSASHIEPWPVSVFVNRVSYYVTLTVPASSMPERDGSLSPYISSLSSSESNIDSRLSPRSNHDGGSTTVEKLVLHGPLVYVFTSIKHTYLFTLRRRLIQSASVLHGRHLAHAFAMECPELRSAIRRHIVYLRSIQAGIARPA